MKIATNANISSRATGKKAELRARGRLDRVMVETDRLDGKEASSIVIALFNK
jgi:hypothetical protein